MHATAFHRLTTVVTALAVGLAPAAHAQYVWDGSSNNNWDNSANWTGSSGWPDDPADSVRFDDTANRADVDLRGGDRDVGNMVFDTAQDYTFGSNTGGAGILRINGNIDFDFIGGSATFASAIDVVQAGGGVWNTFGRLTVDAALRGSANLTVTNGARFNAANPFSGAITFNGGASTLGHPDAFANARVVIGSDDALDINGLDARFGALAGAGSLDLGSQTVTVGGRNQSTTFAGVLSGTSGAELHHIGTGTLTLTGGTAGEPSSLGTLSSTDSSGGIVIDGARIDLTSDNALIGTDSDIRIQDGADVRLPVTGQLRDATLTIAGDTTALSAARLDAAEHVGESGAILVEDGASLTTDHLVIGFAGDGELTVQSGAAANSLVRTYVGITGSGDALVTGAGSLLSTAVLNLGGQTSSSFGGVGTLTVADGGAVQVSGPTRFWSSLSSVTVDRGTLETGRLFEHTGVAGTISLSDPNGGVALTVGVNDADTTFAGLIQDATGGPGSVRKVGSGALTLAGASTFSGDAAIDAGQVVLAHANALQNATVRINADDALDINGLDATLGGLAGNGALDIGAQAVAVGGNGASTTYSGALAGTAGFRKLGAGTLTLAGASTFSGDAAIDAGQVVLAHANALQNATVRINADDALDINGLDATLGGLAGDGALDIGAQAVAVGGNGASTTYSGELAGTAGFRKVGAGTLTLTAPNPFSGYLRIDDGVVQLGDPNALRRAVVWPNTGQFDLNGLDATTGGLNGVGDLDLGGSTLTLRLSVPYADYAGAISGTGRLVIGASESYQWLAGASTFSGGVVLDGGKALTGGSSCFGTGPVTVRGVGAAIRSASTTDLANDIQLEGHLAVDGFNAPVTLSGTISESGGSFGLRKREFGPVTLAGASTFSGPTDIDEGQLVVAHADALQNTTVSINHDDGLDVTTHAVDAHLGGLAGVGDLHIGLQTVSVGANDADTHYSGALSGGGSLDKQGGGALTLAGALNGLGTLRNTGTGDLHVAGGGAADRLLAPAGHTRLRAALDLNGESTNTLFVSGNGSATVENGAVVALTGTGGAHRTVLTQNALLTVAGNGSTLVTPRLDIGPSGAGSCQVIAQLGGTIEADRLRIGDLAGDDGAAGTLSVRSGGAVVADQTALLRRGTLDISRGTLTTDQLIDADAEPHVVSISDPNGGPALTIGVNGGSSVVSALIQDAAAGAGSLRKVGGGTLELVNENTYTGGTTIDGGTVLVKTGTSSHVGSGALTVNSGGTFAGSGPVHDVVVNAGGSLSPGFSGAPTGLIATSDLEFRTGSTLAIDLGGTAPSAHDWVLAGTATVTVAGGTLDLRYANGFTASPGDTFEVLSGWDGLTGAFDTIIFPDDQTWFIDYRSGAPGSVTVGVCADADGDGVCDADDICPGFDDTIDSDGDGVPDGCDVCPDFDDNVDSDGDGIPDGCDVPCPGDTDGDFDTDIDDLLSVLAAFGHPGPDSPGDADDDGDTDIDDLLQVLANFGTTCG